MAITFSMARLFFAVAVFAACIAFARAVGNEDFLVPLALALPAAGLALVVKFRDLPLILRTYFVTACGTMVFSILFMPTTRSPSHLDDFTAIPVLGTLLGWIAATWLNEWDRRRASLSTEDEAFSKSKHPEAEQSPERKNVS